MRQITFFHLKIKFEPLRRTSVRFSFRRSSGRMHCPGSTSARSCTFEQVCSRCRAFWQSPIGRAQRIGEGLQPFCEQRGSSRTPFWLNFSLYPRFPRFFYFKIADFFFPRQNWILSWLFQPKNLYNFFLSYL